MLKQQLPFSFTPISSDTPVYCDGQLIRTLNKCGVFLCHCGEIRISLENKPYLIKHGDIYIFQPSTMVRLLQKSDDAEGLIVEADLDYVVPLLNKVANVENLLFMRKHPCASMSEEQYAHISAMIGNIKGRIKTESEAKATPQRQRLIVELIKSIAQTLCYEILDIYFAHQPLQPLQQDKKDLIFHNFYLSLFHTYRKERDVNYYARLQHISPRYFSNIIKEKSGQSASYWIIQMVITEAKQLLECSDLSIKEIAAQLNFPTQSFFGKYFKQYAGMSPKEYRKQYF